MPLTERRYYTNTAVQQTLGVAVTSSDLTFTTGGSYATWPTTFPFYAVVDDTEPTMEIVKVTGIAGTSATVVRGQNNTSAVSHPIGATFTPAIIAKDLDEANAHTAAAAGVHGISGNVVGDTDVQTIKNKTLDATNTLANPVVTGTAQLAAANASGNITVGGTLAVTGQSTFTGQANFNGTANDKHSLPIAGRSILRFTNTNSTVSSVDANGVLHLVTLVWDTTEFSVGDITDHRTTDGAMIVNTPGIYLYSVVTALPTGLPDVHFTQGLVVNGGLAGTARDSGSMAYTGTYTATGFVKLDAGDRCQLGYLQAASTAQNFTAVSFTLALHTPS